MPASRGPGTRQPRARAEQAGGGAELMSGAPKVTAFDHLVKPIIASAKRAPELMIDG
jgi:hypothetical protein